MAKKWWHHIPAVTNARRRLRAGYRGALRHNTALAEVRAGAYYAKKLAEAQAKMDSQVDALNRRVEYAEQVMREVVRVRLEYGPHQFGMRFTVFATMDETYIRNTHYLGDHASYILEMLARKLGHEFKQIDFNRVKPNRWEPDERKRAGAYPVYRIDLPEVKP